MLDDLKQALQEQALSGVLPNPDLPIKPLTGVYRQRQVELGIALYQLMGIAREDKEKKDQWMLKQLRAFDAPNAIIVSIEQEADSPLALFSLGTVTQNIALAAVNFGLGTCIQHVLTYYPEVVRQIAGIPESKRLAIGISIGYPDWDFPANKLESTREPLANIVAWRGV